MTTRRDYTDEEWETLEALPFLVGAAIVAVSLSGIAGKIKEGLSLAFGVLDTAKQFPDNTLIEGLLGSHHMKYGDEEKREDTKTLEREDVVEFVLEKCREIVALLEQRSTPQESEEYKTWLMLSAEHVARAAKAGGFLGIGGKLIDKQEEQFLQTLAETLGVSRNLPDTP